MEFLAYILLPWVLGLGLVGGLANDDDDTDEPVVENEPDITDTIEVVNLSPNDDTASGGPGDQLISGFAGDDSIHGSAGDDEIYGNEGDDTLQGGGDNDIVGGGAGDDTVLGNAGNDYLDGGAGADKMNGGLGDDFILGQTGDDVLNGSDGNDIIFGNGNDDLIGGDDGDDVLLGGFGADTLLGGNGNDVLDGSMTLSNTVFAEDGFTILNDPAALDAALTVSSYDDSAADTLFAGAGDDTLVLGNGDTGQGGNGSDTFELLTSGLSAVDAANDDAAIVKDYDSSEDIITLVVPEGAADPVITVQASTDTADTDLYADGELVATLTGVAVADFDVAAVQLLAV